MFSLALNQIKAFISLETYEKTFLGALSYLTLFEVENTDVAVSTSALSTPLLFLHLLCPPILAGGRMMRLGLSTPHLHWSKPVVESSHLPMVVGSVCPVNKAQSEESTTVFGG